MFKEIMLKRLTVRETERLARAIAVEKQRGPRIARNREIAELEAVLSEALHTRVQIEEKKEGGKITIDYFSPDDLKSLLDLMQGRKAAEAKQADVQSSVPLPAEPATAIDDRSKEEKHEDENTDELYSIKNFSL